MTGTRKKELLVYCGYTLMILTAIMCRFIPETRVENSPQDFILSLARPLIYILLFVLTGISFQRRIIHKTVKRLFLGVSLLSVFWLIVRTLKYMVFSDLFRQRMMWYSYYIPMLFIPTLCLLIAFAIGKPWGFRLSGRMRLLLVPPAVISLLVLLNDTHQLVFRFRGPKPWADRDYTYGVIYWVCLVWCVGCALCTLALLIKKCRVPRSRGFLFLPFLSLSVALVYGVLYISELELLRVIAGDMTAFFCLVYTATLECCIQCGLIQSNIHYSELFRASTIAAQITDSEYHILLSSDCAAQYSEEQMRRTEQSPIISDNGIRLSGAAVTGGHVLWQEDVSELAAVLRSLEEVEADLEDGNLVLEENYRTTRSVKRLEVQNHLYDTIRKETAARIELSSNLLNRFQASADEGEKRRILEKLIVIGAYLKRRNNLIFIREKNDRLAPRELKLCIEESLDNLRLCDIECSCYLSASDDIPSDTAIALYDFFEAVTEAAFDSLSCMMVRVLKRNEMYYAVIDVECEEELSSLQGETVSLLKDGDGITTLIMSITAGGVGI